MSLPIRFYIGLLGAYACALVYMHRAGISVAIVAMTSTANDTKPEFDWNEKLQGIILGSQFYLYIFVPTIAGRATDALGGRWIAFIGAFGPFILAALTPMMVYYGGSTAFIVNRILVGGFHGFTYAAMYSLFVKWFPINELATANGSLVFGGSLGGTIMSALAGVISQYLSWSWVFYVIAIFHVPFLVFWFILSTNEPKTNKYISTNERQYIIENAQEKIISNKIKAPWIRMIFSVPVFCSLITKMCSGFGYFLLITKMPSYLKLFKVGLSNTGWIFGGANMANCIANLFAPPLASMLISRLGWRRLIVRKLFQSLALFGPALSLGLIPFIENNHILVIYLLVQAMTMYGFFTAGEWTIVSEYAPNFAGTLFGIGNILAFSMGVVAPYLVGIILDNVDEATQSQWNKIFIITVAIYLIGGFVFLFLATDKQQSWDREAIANIINTNSNNITDDNITNNQAMELSDKTA